MMRNVTLLSATGSIDGSTLDRIATPRVGSLDAALAIDSQARATACAMLGLAALVNDRGALT